MRLERSILIVVVAMVSSGIYNTVYAKTIMPLLKKRTQIDKGGRAKV